ncbi:HesA/MoeB/ThiF family protein [Frigidibacter sp. MR17.24]|uniref:HesA/MoeB/ThiF family protein n=1 Tax=Frigidibacter sp. MR17.24 TaxID=3127345 RepID=UPI003012A7A3
MPALPGGTLMLVAAIAAALLALAWALRLPRRVLATMLALLWLAALSAHLVLPEGAGLRRAIGGSAAGWFALGLAVAAVLAYRGGLARLRARVAAAPDPASDRPAGAFSSAELDRYARHIVLRELGGPGQRKLKAARVLVIGAGGLGSPALLYLAAAGVGTIGIVDDDTVSNSNLQRQVIHRDADIGRPKVASAAREMTALNPHVTVIAHPIRLEADSAARLCADYDLVLDGTDNFATRLLVNAACVAARKPLISAAITQWEGQISLYDPAAGAPCYACIFPQEPAEGLAPSCAVAGVVGALPGVVGAMMALEAVKELGGVTASGAGLSLRGRMMLYDALWGENRTIAIRRRPDCPTCGGLHG